MPGFMSTHRYLKVQSVEVALRNRVLKLLVENWVAVVLDHCSFPFRFLVTVWQQVQLHVGIWHVVWVLVWQWQVSKNNFFLFNTNLYVKIEYFCCDFNEWIITQFCERWRQVSASARCSERWVVCVQVWLHLRKM